MKKVILAIDNKKIFNKIKEINNLKLNIKNVQYREAILEILKKEKNIDFIFINEKLSGEISIEDLINKIKIINKKIKIIFFLEKEDIKKENKLKKLGIKNIYIINKINLNKILNLLEENKLENIKKNNIKKNIDNNIIKENIKNKIITIYGEPKSGKSTIIILLIIYLIEKNKKILLINLNKKIEKNYLIFFDKRYLKNKKTKNNKLENNIKINNIKNEKINKNLILINNFENNFKRFKEKSIEESFKFLIRKYKNNYDYILFDIGYTISKILKDIIIEKSDKKVIVGNKNLLSIPEIKEKIKKEEENKEITDMSLHIIQNKYYFNSISYLIIKNIVNDFCNVHKILYNKNYIKLSQKILKNEKIKIKKSTKKIIEKILN